jgi:glutamine amidotransferase-like uncharacterized protein
VERWKNIKIIFLLAVGILGTVAFAKSAGTAFRTFTNSDMGLNGLVPEGWSEVRPGEFERSHSDNDPTVLVQIGITGLGVEQAKTLILAKLGIDELPESNGSVRTSSFAWDLYVIESDDPEASTPIVDLALAQTEERVCIVILVAQPDQYSDLHYNVFLRALDALTPIASEEAGKRAARASLDTDESRSAEVILIKGEKLENQSCDVVADLLQTELALRTKFVEIESLGEIDFRDVKLIFFPGGEAATINLSERAAVRIRRAVASGTGYMGMCCGAFVAAEAVASAPHIYGRRRGCVLGIFPGTAEWAGGDGMLPFYIGVRHPIIANSSVAERIRPVMNLRFVGGTSNITPSYASKLENWRVASLDKPKRGSLMGDRAVMTATVFGKGRVFLSGPHPESREQTHPITLAAAEWCTRKSDPKNSPPPLIKQDISTEEFANRFFTCSASGSQDPSGLPIGFIWDFGDGSPKQFRPDAVHIYKEPGQYAVTLTVSTGSKHSTKTTKVTIHEQDED